MECMNFKIERLLRKQLTNVHPRRDDFNFSSVACRRWTALFIAMRELIMSLIAFERLVPRQTNLSDEANRKSSTSRKFRSSGRRKFEPRASRISKAPGSILEWIFVLGPLSILQGEKGREKGRDAKASRQRNFAAALRRCGFVRGRVSR